MRLVGAKMEDGDERNRADDRRAQHGEQRRSGNWLKAVCIATATVAGDEPHQVEVEVARSSRVSRSANSCAMAARIASVVPCMIAVPKPRTSQVPAP